jgi:hypothetical protein
MSIIPKKKSKTKINKVLGVDASTNSLAFCQYGPNGPEKWGEIKFRGASVFERLAYAEQIVKLATDSLEYDMIVFEGAVYVQNKKTVILLAYAYGAIISSLAHKGAAVEDVNPIHWQRFIGNPPLTKDEKAVVVKDNPGKSKSWYDAKNRQTRKERTMKWAEDTFNIVVTSDNVSDAIGVAHYGYNSFGG